MTFFWEHVRKFKRSNEKISVKNHANTITSLVRRIYEAQDKNQLAYIEKLLINYLLGMSLPKTIRPALHKEGLPQYVELFKTQFQKELLGNMSAVFQVEDKHVTYLLAWAKKLLKLTGALRTTIQRSSSSRWSIQTPCNLRKRSRLLCMTYYI